MTILNYVKHLLANAREQIFIVALKRIIEKICDNECSKGGIKVVIRKSSTNKGEPTVSLILVDDAIVLYEGTEARDQGK